MDTLDLSGKKLKKLNKPTHSEAQVTTLILDDNELQRLDNIDSFIKVQKLSVVRNQLLRMYGVCRLHSLHTLNLAQNGILTIEGIKELVNLKYFCLAGNNIKTIEHLNTNVNLESLDLSENNITHITDLSHLKNLKFTGRVVVLPRTWPSFQNRRSKRIKSVFSNCMSSYRRDFGNRRRP